ncbi:hypothetical protein BAE44_0003859 [Dichanthelium oligosanthes]|uniref:C2H2-type domain-containing protein n=1 Tax=Dichanthelium oligosanthes TaxID=888268 RepID=A0A1E5WCG2_9POAL|nr:hypothetical protein BAE44_0003859 [Dichanthelium oligosanthes]
MDPRAYEFQLQAAEAAAAEAASPVRAADDDEPEPPIPKALELEAQGSADATPAPQQGSGVAPMGAGNAEAFIKCPECPKMFPTAKALFGHLRKHPERGYKGSTRPATASAAATVAGDKKPKPKPKPKPKDVAQKEDDVSAMNVTAAAAVAGEKKLWEHAELSSKRPVTTKRGRALEAGMQASSGEEVEAARALLQMASSSRSTSETGQQESVQQVHAPDAVSWHRILPDVEQPMLLDHVDDEHQTPEAEQTVQPEIVLELSAESQTPAVKELTDLEITAQAFVIMVAENKSIAPGSSSEAGAKETKNKKPRVLDLEQTASSPAPPPPPKGDNGKAPWRIPPPASNKKYGCPKCGKSFPSHQALGGHMSSHVKGKSEGDDRNLALIESVQTILANRRYSGDSFFTGGSYGMGFGASKFLAASYGAGAGMGQVVPPPAAAHRAEQHACAECRMFFPSGQALGGHMRRHWLPKAAPAKPQPAPAPAPAPTPVEPAPAPAPAVLDFNLNELPEEAEGETDQP